MENFQVDFYHLNNPQNQDLTLLNFMINIYIYILREKENSIKFHFSLN